MKILQCFSAVTILLAFVNITSVDCDENLCKTFKEALLKEENIYSLQNIFYPYDGSVASEVIIELSIILEDDCSDNFTKQSYTLHISTNNLWKINLYLKKISVFLRYTDLTFHKLLSKLTNNHNTENSNLSLTLCNNANLTEEECERCLMSLFSWVSECFKPAYY